MTIGYSSNDNKEKNDNQQLRPKLEEKNFNDSKIESASPRITGKIPEKNSPDIKSGPAEKKPLLKRIFIQIKRGFFKLPFVNRFDKNQKGKNVSTRELVNTRVLLSFYTESKN